MIYVVEPQCKNWEHEEVNAGFLNLIDEVLYDKEIVFFGDIAHIEAVRTIMEKRNVTTSIVFEEIILPEITNSQIDIKAYDELLKRILEKNEALPERIIFLSGYYQNMCSVNKLAISYPSIEITILLHAINELLFSNKKIHRKYFEGYFKYKGVLKRLANRNNVRFLVLGPLFFEAIQGKLSGNIIKKFDFIHHPYIFNKIEKDERQEHKIKICVLGAAVNAECKNIIKKVNSLTSSNSYEFIISNRINTEINGDNIILINHNKALTRESIDALLAECDWMLLAYPKEKYIVSASGILFDAINSEIPLLMLDSNCLKYYSKYNIGILKTNIDDLAEEILKIISDSTEMPYSDYKIGFENCKTEIIKNNQNKIRELFQ